MVIKQWEDKNLSHFSYAVLSECESKIVLVDPARNPEQYLEFAKQHNAEIIGIIETHPHADFVSSHKELSELTGATVYVSKLVNAGYDHKSFDEGDEIRFGKIRMYALNTPGHSPDSISIVLEHDGKPNAVFTGDTLFIGDCGRPDLREGAGNIKATRDSLARDMYASLRNKLMVLPDDVLVYPAHGAGTLCGKSLSKAQSSTIGAEKMTNWSLQDMTGQEFVENLLSGQPFIPAYFPHDVEMNRVGAPAFRAGIEKIKIDKPVSSAEEASVLNKNLWIIDARGEKDFKEQHLDRSINLMEDGKFETWLGTIIKPGEKFYLTGGSEEQLEKLFERIAAIGYEEQVEKAFVLEYGEKRTGALDVKEFKEDLEDYTIVDVRNPSEVETKKIFEDSIAIPLSELRSRIGEIPVGKPIVVHCAGGYRSAAGSSLIASKLNGNAVVYDLGEKVKEF